MSSSNLEKAAAAFFTTPFDGVIRVELIDDPEAVWVDGRHTPPTISETSPPGVDSRFCLWRIDPLDVPLVLVPDAKRFENGLIAGRVKVSGDMAVMMRLEFADA